jgi:prophage tail gpP-like protein
MNDPLDPRNCVRLLVAGEDFGGWLSVRIAAGIERQARDFDLSVTNTWPGGAEVSRRIQPGAECRVMIGDDLVLTGFVDATPISHDGTSYSVAVKGRSKTADLIDCAAINEPGQWSKRKLEAIAAELAREYGIEVVTEVDTGEPIAEHQIQPGETVWQSMERMLGLVNVLSTDNALGQLVLTDVSPFQTTTALVIGQNIMSCSAQLDWKQRFSEYICKGATSGNDDDYTEPDGVGFDPHEDTGAGDDDDGSAGNAVQTIAVAKDPYFSRRRVKIFTPGGKTDLLSARMKVEYERARAAARCLEIEYKVAGWRQDDGSLWLPNRRVWVSDPIIGFEAEMLIAEVEYSICEQGMVSTLKVGPPDGYRAQVRKTKKGKASTADTEDFGDATLVKFPEK